MQDTGQAGFPRPIDHALRVILGFATVNDERAPCIRGKVDLRRECSELQVAGRIVVVIVEAAFSNCHGARSELLAQERDVARSAELGRVMGMNAGRGEYESRVVGGKARGDFCGSRRLTDADHTLRPRGAGARDYRVAVAGERRVREVGVAVDEVWRGPILRGHLRSIQSRTGAAT